VLAGTGPVGSRVARLLALEGARVQVGSRSRSRATDVCQAVSKRTPNAQLTPLETSSPDDVARALAAAQIVIAAGAPGVELATTAARAASQSLKVAIDLNAVGPLGLGGIEMTDSAAQRDGMTCYGAIGVGGTKMKIHKAAIRQLFTANDQVLDAEEIYRLGRELAG
jgi:saccharopine dehydrogenase-like NADP-dependent oxidoreductase